MPNDTRRFRIQNTRETAITVVLEPWANEYYLAPGAAFDIVETGGESNDLLELHLENGHLVLHARTGTTLAVTQNGVELP